MYIYLDIIIKIRFKTQSNYHAIFETLHVLLIVWNIP